MRGDLGRDLPKIKEVKQQLIGLGNPVGQARYLEALEKRLRHRRIAQLGLHEDLVALEEFIRDEKKKVKEWKEQHLARKIRGQIELTGPAFTAPSGSEDLRNHLRKVRHHNRVLREQADCYYTLLHYNAEQVDRELGAGRAEELAQGFKSNIESWQRRVLGLIEAYADGLEDLEEREKYLRLMHLWYEEADFIHRSYAGLQPFARAREGVKVLLDVSRSDKANHSPRGGSQDNRIVHKHNKPWVHKRGQSLMKEHPEWGPGQIVSAILEEYMEKFKLTVEECPSETTIRRYLGWKA